MKTVSEWTDSDTAKAKKIWKEYQAEHDLIPLKGQAAGIEPISGRVWFGADGLDIKRQMNHDGIDRPFYCIRVGYNYYLRKGGRR